ncbi:MAG: CRISPR-ssociated protein, Cas4 [Leptospirillum sp. Group II 'C75']|jgi:CRISPR system Cascade subunit CasC|uniref:CRISPR-associated protein, Cas4 n=1 Tax=Leptospirillum sp. Group II '5-way CG' TaxID=419541 RepID=B6AMW2_9BACT|nr:type I-E CRISPR-associated protein Cas7/Cse4/CasC [Leptospirillum sp. Group II 'CF-1']AKS22505.1 CRISPR-associated protein Cse4 [Leptospirillum sp. Group II 'CF-1']EAY58009.1 MAG: CRISPR-ssociated protein, Cas4 [Leptospirillum rubarum]EDZ39840.1 MAG: CRISPR-associated protein, Cas4 [Leptospirillum sp. Group II '5-way CG']EIJ76631.1 MAG: CRISPR-ssociated protein, Cas4 [Leptospirillum sp. Group II 'C75']
MKTLIEIHVLQNFAPSNLNRDDTGAPKDALFGGTRRARISSQCIKRSVRDFFCHKREDGIFSPDEIGVRTKRIYQAIADLLKEKRDISDTITKAKTALSYLKIKPKNEKTQYLLFLSPKEIKDFANAIDEYWDQIVGEPIETDNSELDEETPDTVSLEEQKPKKGKKNKKPNIPKEFQEKLESVLNGGKSIDIALFGRMLADIPEKNQNAACQVAHAISTHAVEREFDYYTAIDDLKPDDTAGSDMIGTVEFNSACFYRYAVVDLEALNKNLHDDSELTNKSIRAFLEAFIISEPTGKQNSFAAHNPPEFIAISVRHNAGPRNLANAFETAVFPKKGESLTRKSADELVKKAKSLQSAFGGEDKTFLINLVGTNVNGYGTVVASLEDLLNKTLSAIER